MHTVQVVLYIVALILLLLAAVGVPARVSLALLGAACGLAAYAAPTIAGHGL